MKTYLSAVLIVVVAVLVTACSDPKAANEKNFKIAIQKPLDKAYPRCYIKTNFPTTASSQKQQYKNYTSVFKVMVASGLLSEKEESREVKDGWQLFATKPKMKTVVETVFNLTEEGKKFYKADVIENNGFGETVGGFCFGKATVKDVSEFTEPADAGGMRATRVTYTYEVRDFPAWAKLPDFLAVLPELKKDVESDKSPIKGLDMLVLTNNGWVSQLGGMLR